MAFVFVADFAVAASAVAVKPGEAGTSAQGGDYQVFKRRGDIA